MVFAQNLQLHAFVINISITPLRTSFQLCGFVRAAAIRARAGCYYLQHVKLLSGARASRHYHLLVRGVLYRLLITPMKHLKYVGYTHKHTPTRVGALHFW